MTLFRHRNVFQTEYFHTDTTRFYFLQVFFEIFPQITLLSDTSLSEINKTLHINSINYMQNTEFQPNIIIWTYNGKPFQEFKWKQIKIGSQLIINNISNIKPWNR